MRREELAGLKGVDVDLDEQCGYLMGNGRRRRRVPFGKQTALAVDRYPRARDQHPRAKSPMLWLGHKGPMTGSGVCQTVDERAAKAGIDHLYPHKFRHTFAHEWLAEGGQEGDLMRLAGGDPGACSAVTAPRPPTTAPPRAHRRLGLGDRL